MKWICTRAWPRASSSSLNKASSCCCCTEARGSVGKGRVLEKKATHAPPSALSFMLPPLHIILYNLYYNRKQEEKKQDGHAWRRQAGQLCCTKTRQASSHHPPSILSHIQSLVSSTRRALVCASQSINGRSYTGEREMRTNLERT